MTAPRGRPPIGKPLLVRLTDETRARLAARKVRPREPLAEVVRRLLDIALNLPDQEKRDPDDSK